MAFEVEFSKRLDLFGAEIFAALNDKKVALEAQGKKLYNLSVGTPDFEPMPHIKQALCDAAMVSENWKYSLRDLPELKRIGKPHKTPQKQHAENIPSPCWGTRYLLHIYHQSNIKLSSAIRCSMHQDVGRFCAAGPASCRSIDIIIV